jgi:hypothetical protein
MQMLVNVVQINNISMDCFKMTGVVAHNKFYKHNLTYTGICNELV